VSNSSPVSALLDAKPGFDILEPHPTRLLLVFQLADRFAALPLEVVERIAPMAELACPPGLPSALEGILNLAGAAIPVLRLDRLFRLPTQRLGLYSMLVILRAPSEGRLAILVDRVSETLSVPANALLPIEPEDSFNGCAEATVAVNGETIHVLSPARMLLAKEREALSEFQTMAQRRLQDWEAGQA
jgi:purine-binding chemotaxis protein CheW